MIWGAMKFVRGGWEGGGDCNGLGGGRSGRGRLGVGTRLKGEAMTGNGLEGNEVGAAGDADTIEREKKGK